MILEDAIGTTLSLGQLWVFHHVAHTNSITQSAEMLYRAQSAVTRNIQKLEEAVGEALFERRPSGVLLSAVGQCVLTRAKRVFAELETLNQWCSTQGGRKCVPGAMPPYLLNTRRLHLLIAVAGSLHMPTAARTLGVTQAAVSAAIKVLETSSGLQLFKRSGRGIEITAQGSEFVLRARLAINELNLIADDISALKGNLRGKVIVGITPSARTMLFPKAVARVSSRFPGIRICTEESPYEFLNAELRAGKIDFILTSMSVNSDSPGMTSEFLVMDKLVVVARSGHALAARRNMKLSALVSEQWIFPHLYAPMRRLVDDLFAHQNVAPPTPVVETSDSAILLGTLTHTDMIAVLSRQQLSPAIASGALTVLDVDIPRIDRSLCLRWRKGHPSPAAQALMNTLKEVAAQ